MKIIKFDDRKAFIYRMRKLKIKSHRLHQWKLKTPKSGVFYYIIIHYVSISNRPQRLVKPSYSMQLNTNHIFHYDQALVSASFPFVSI